MSALRPLVAAITMTLLAGVLSLVSAGTAHAADRDCGDFATQKAAQIFFLNHDPRNDPHNLDADGDMVVCESLPCPCYTGTTPPDNPPAPPTGPPTGDLLGRIVKVTDGDTVKVRVRTGRTYAVRVVGIDTPEVYGGIECGGPKASASMKRKLPIGTPVRLIRDRSQANVDRYGRLLRYVIKRSNGLDAGRAQLREGWAEVYVYRHNPFNRIASYRRAQRYAKSHNLGIWKLCR